MVSMTYKTFWESSCHSAGQAIPPSRDWHTPHGHHNQGTTYQSQGALDYWEKGQYLLTTGAFCRTRTPPNRTIWMTSQEDRQVCSGSILDHSRRARDCIPTDKHSCFHTFAAYGPYLPPKCTPVFLTHRSAQKGQTDQVLWAPHSVFQTEFELFEETSNCLRKTPVLYNQTLSF